MRPFQPMPGSASAEYAILLDSVTKVYGSGKSAVHALREVSLGLARGSFTAVMGPSGSGKSTMLHCAAGLDQPSSGSVWLGGVELSGMNERQLTKLRRVKVGFVFQAYNLVNSLTVAELVGATSAQLKRTMRTEAFVVAFIAVVIGSLLSLLPLVGVRLGLSEGRIATPVVSLPTYLLTVAGSVLLGLLSIMIPTRVALRGKPAETIGTRE